MIEDLKTDSEIWKAERRAAAVHSDPTKHYSKRHHYGADTSYTADVPATYDWHVPRDSYEAHCSQLNSLERCQAELEEDAEFSSAMDFERGTMPSQCWKTWLADLP